MTTNQIREYQVSGKNADGSDIPATLTRLTRDHAVLVIYDPGTVLRVSQAITDFTINFNAATIYSGRGVVGSVINLGDCFVCEIKLAEEGFKSNATAPVESIDVSSPDFCSFLNEWQKVYRVRSEFKVVVADLHWFLTDLRSWLERVELEIGSASSAERTRQEINVIDQLNKPVVHAIDTFIERFETIAADLDAELVPAHRAYLRRHLHPLILCSPFANRAYQKPLGYAGDYELVDMMIRSPVEGKTLYARIINMWLLGQSPAAAHRNRVEYLCRKLVEEAVRVRASGQPLRVFNLGCGPAEELRRFIQEDAVSDQANLTVVDFNDETLAVLRRKLEKIKNQYHRQTRIQFVKKSVHQMLKEAARSPGNKQSQQFDFVYCAGLFDYLSDQVCKKLMSQLYGMLAPGGLLLATNVSDALNDTRPFRYSMEYFLDWHLIYRNGPAMATLAPTCRPEDSTKVITENLGVNVFLEMRKSRDV